MTEVLTRWQNTVGCVHFWCASSGEPDNLWSSFRTRFFSLPLPVNGFPQGASLRTAHAELERTFEERIYSNSRTELLRVRCCPLAGQCQRVIWREINPSRFNNYPCPFKCRQPLAGFAETWSFSFDSVGFDAGIILETDIETSKICYLKMQTCCLKMLIYLYVAINKHLTNMNFYEYLFLYFKAHLISCNRGVMLFLNLAGM